MHHPHCMREAQRLPENGQVRPPRPRHILLITPFYIKDPHASFGKHVLTPNLALTSIAAATPEGWEVRFWDENLLQGLPPMDPFPAVVGISVHLTSAERSYELADWYRQRGSIVVLGGLHVISCPEEAEAHADILAIGEGVQMWPGILRDIEAGDFSKRYTGTFRRPYSEEPPPRREILPSEQYLTTASVIATRGCHNRCGFCYLSTTGIDMPYQVLEPERVAADILRTGEPYAVFTDNNLGSRPEYLRALSRALAPLGIIWSAAVTIDVTNDETLVRDMALSGCTGVFIGFESLAGENLDAARKRSPRPEDYARRVAIFHRYGIQVNGSFMFGFDEDEPDVFEKTVRWIEQNRLECATFHIVTPYPGTPLFKQMESEGRLIHTDWQLYDTCHVVFQPMRMTVRELEEGYAWAYRELFRWRSIWSRRPENLRDVAPYLGMSLLYKKSNRLWPWVIRHRLTHRLWRPLVEASRQRHLGFRKRLAEAEEGNRVPAPIMPGV